MTGLGTGLRSQKKIGRPPLFGTPDMIQDYLNYPKLSQVSESENFSLDVITPVGDVSESMGDTR